MTFYSAITNAPKEKAYHGRIIANTKSPSRFKGMSREDFEKELKENPICCFPFEIVEFN